MSMHEHITFLCESPEYVKKYNEMPKTCKGCVSAKRRWFKWKPGNSEDCKECVRNHKRIWRLPVYSHDNYHAKHVKYLTNGRV
jgi:hypothetical protein